MSGIAYYIERYRDNDNMMRAIVELKMQKNEELKKENEMQRARLERLSNKE